MAGTSDALRLGRMDRRLLPAGLLQELGSPLPPLGRTPRDWVVDVAMFVLVGVLAAVVLVEVWPEQSTALHVTELVLGPLSVLALWWRRRAPVPVAVFAVLASGVSGIAAASSLAALFNVGVHRSPRTAAWALALSLVVLAPYHVIYPDPDGGLDVQDLVVGVLLTVATVGWGLFVRSRRQLLVSVYDRALRAEADEQAKADGARRAERTRIAREMHDVLAHRVSMVSLHAGALEYRPDASPEEVARAAGVIRAAAHDALDELRTVIGVLRDDAEPGAVAPPQPGLQDVGALVEEVRGAGVRVDLHEQVRAGASADGVGRTAYRIVQEGLTNARKHAPGARVSVALRGAPGDGLRVEVANGLPLGEGPTAVPGAGTGLVGLAERATLAGGTLEHGRREDRFVLRAELPWPR